MFELTETDLLSRLKNCEDTFVERKTASDSSDWVKTIVAFANSTPIDYPAVLFIGARDDGSIEERPLDFDGLQKTLNKKMEPVYPSIYYLSKLVNEAGKHCLAVIIPGSSIRPHFAGPSYVRIGSETRVASETQFNTLVAERQSKPYEILKWRGKNITVDHMNTESAIMMMGSIRSSQVATVIDCNSFYVTLDVQSSYQMSIPLNRINISFNTEKKHLKLEVHPV